MHSRRLAIPLLRRISAERRRQFFLCWKQAQISIVLSLMKMLPWSLSQTLSRDKINFHSERMSFWLIHCIEIRKEKEEEEENSVFQFGHVRFQTRILSTDIFVPTLSTGSNDPGVLVVVWKREWLSIELFFNTSNRTDRHYEGNRLDNRWRCACEDRRFHLQRHNSVLELFVGVHYLSVVIVRPVSIRARFRCRIVDRIRHNISNRSGRKSNHQEMCIDPKPMKRIALESSARRTSFAMPLSQVASYFAPFAYFNVPCPWNSPSLNSPR